MARQGAATAAVRRNTAQWTPSVARRRSTDRPVAPVAPGCVGITQRRIASPGRVERDPFSFADDRRPVPDSRGPSALGTTAVLRGPARYQAPEGNAGAPKRD